MIPAFIEKIRGRVNIDVAFGDTIYPAKEIIQYLLLIEKEIPVLYAYSKETIIAEKLHAVVTLGLMNSRLKDFYDLYVLMMTNSFDGIILQNAIEETFKHRNSVFNEILAFETEFIDQYRLQQWKSFLKKKSPNFIIELEDIIVCIKNFSLPLIESIKKNESFNMKWNHQSQN